MNRKNVIMLIGVFLLSGFGLVLAQDGSMLIDEETNLVTYKAVVDLQGNKKNDLYDKAFNWCNSFYKNPRDVIRKKDVLNGEIVCKGKFRVYTPASKNQIKTPAGIVQYTLMLQFKDDRYRYTITSFNWKQSSYYPIERWMETEKDTYLPVYAKYLNQVDENIKELEKSLLTEMSKPVKEKADDW